MNVTAPVTESVAIRVEALRTRRRSHEQAGSNGSQRGHSRRPDRPRMSKTKKKIDSGAEYEVHGLSDQGKVGAWRVIRAMGCTVVEGDRLRPRPTVVGFVCDLDPNGELVARAASWL